jgi:hypothetical protein
MPQNNGQSKGSGNQNEGTGEPFSLEEMQARLTASERADRYNDLASRFALFPDALKQGQQFVVYKLGRRPKKDNTVELLKRPYNARTGQLACVNDPDT